MATVSTSFTATGQSASLRLQAVGDDVTIDLSGTWVATVILERALNPDESAWEAVAGPFTENVVVEYQVKTKNETLRLRCTAFTSGTVVTVISDPDLVIHELFDAFGNLLMRYTQDGAHEHTGAESHTGAETHSGDETHSGVETHSGDETHSGAETHSGVETHSGNETHSGDETHTGRETFVRVDGAQVPEMFTVAAPTTDLDDTATMSAAQQVARILECLPTAAATYTTRTGTEIEAALPATVVTGDCFLQTIINLATVAGRDITLADGVGVSTVGDMVVDAQDADGNNAVGLFLYRRSAANTFIIYRVG